MTTLWTFILRGGYFGLSAIQLLRRHVPPPLTSNGSFEHTRPPTGGKVLSSFTLGPMNKKKQLTVAVATIAVIGFAFAATPFVRSLSLNPKQENEAWGACDVSGLPPGEFEQCGWAMVYRRTMLDKDRKSVV